jgi:hypothetical protein
MTLAQAKKLKSGDILLTVGKKYTNYDGTPQRWRVTGKVKLWKKDPKRILVPLKRGLYSYFHLTENSLSLFKKER